MHPDENPGIGWAVSAASSMDPTIAAQFVDFMPPPGYRSQAVSSEHHSRIAKEAGSLSLKEEEPAEE